MLFIMYCHLWDYDYGVHYHMVHIISIGKNIGFEVGSVGLRSSVMMSPVGITNYCDSTKVH
jgi:hypothetical protein